MFLMSGDLTGLCLYIVYFSVNIQIYCLVLFSVLAHVVIKVQVYNYVSLLIIFFGCINLQLLRLSFTTLDTTPHPPSTHLLLYLWSNFFLIFNFKMLLQFLHHFVQELYYLRMLFSTTSELVATGLIFELKLYFN